MAQTYYWKLNGTTIEQILIRDSETDTVPSGFEATTKAKIDAMTEVIKQYTKDGSGDPSSPSGTYDYTIDP